MYSNFVCYDEIIAKRKDWFFQACNLIAVSKQTYGSENSWQQLVLLPRQIIEWTYINEQSARPPSPFLVSVCFTPDWRKTLVNTLSAVAKNRDPSNLNLIWLFVSTRPVGRQSPAQSMSYRMSLPPHWFPATYSDFSRESNEWLFEQANLGTGHLIIWWRGWNRKAIVYRWDLINFPILSSLWVCVCAGVAVLWAESYIKSGQHRYRSLQAKQGRDNTPTASRTSQTPLCISAAVDYC